MRRAAKADANQAEIVAALRARGATVLMTHQLSSGQKQCGLDLDVGYQGIDQRVEIKDGSKPPSAQKLTPAEDEEIRTWKGRPIEIVTSVDDAMKMLDKMYMEAAW